MPQPKTQQNPFDQFTNLYSLSKTLRLSLIPVLTKKQEDEIKQEKGYENSDQIRRQDRIEKFFIDNKRDIFEVDIEKKKRYMVLKYYLTELHKLFIKDALSKIKNNSEINFSDLFANYKKFEIAKDGDQRKQLAKIISDQKVVLAKFFGDKEGKGGIFQETAEEYYDWLIKNLSDGEKIPDDKNKKQRKNNILLTQNVLLALDKKIKSGDIKEKIEEYKNGNNKYALVNLKWLEKGELIEGTLMEYFDGWSTYFKNFNDIRGNLYKDAGRREENEESEGETRIKKANAGQLTTRILDENFEIFVRNAVWAENNKNNLELNDFQNKNVVEVEILGRGNKNISIFDPKFYAYCLLQIDINTYNAKIAELNKFLNENKKKNMEIKYLKPLQKQLLLTDKPEGEEEDFVREFVDDIDLINGLDEFYSHSRKKILTIRDLLKDGKIEDNLDDILLNENQLHYFCNKYFGSWSYLRDLYYRQNNVPGTYQSKKEDDFKDVEGIYKIDVSLSEIQKLLNNEENEDFIEAIKAGWFCRDFNNPFKSSVSILKEAGIYKEDSSNFENFVSFLSFELQSLLNGRGLLTKRENEDKEKINATKVALQKNREQGERVDSLLLSKFSEDNFIKNITESIETKEINFQKALQELGDSVKKKQRLTREADFECKKSINEYCTRISDINGFFALFSVPVVLGVINNTVLSFKENNKIISLFNEIRNYITKRSDEIEKIKLNFDYPTLFKGWGYKTSDYKCRLYKKDGKIYVGIVGRKPHSFLDSKCQLMDYYQLDGKGIFNVYRGLFDGRKYKEDDRPQLKNKILLERIEKIIDEKLLDIFPKVRLQLEEIKNNRKSGLYNFEITTETIGDLFTKKTGNKYVDYKKNDKKEIILDILKDDFKISFTSNRENNYFLDRINELFGKNPKRKNFFGVDKMVYQLTQLEPYFYKIKFNFIKPNSNDINISHLFQIYCKDFSQGKDSKSTKNLHTLYFEELFSKENEEKPIFKLSGGAEVFFREKIDEYKVEQWEKKDLQNPKTDKIPNKKRRFTEKQILFHLPIDLNNINKGGNINHEVHECIQESKYGEIIKILGIDRGEKELVYYCLLDKDGRIVGEPKSLNVVGSNVIKGIPQPVNYRNKLDIRVSERMMARRSWTKIEGIKDLKEGYISNVVSEIAKLMVNNNAFVCLEELNHGFKKDRSTRIEKGVYQHLENALVDKLSYLVLKKTPAGIRNALQLVKSVDYEGKKISSKYWGNQMGAIFYADAKFTSKTCPHCGFRRRGVESMNSSKEIIDKINKGELKIFFEERKDRFRIEYAWKVIAFDFSCEDLYGKNKLETIYSDVERDTWNDNTLKEIFKGYLQNGNTELFSLAKNESHFRYVDFGKVFNSLSWIRCNIKKGETDYDVISCPKCHFSTMSQKAKKITNGDANGAYNIARKGLMILGKIRSENLRKKIITKGRIESQDLKINLKEWDEYTYGQWNQKDWIDSENPYGL